MKIGPLSLSFRPFEIGFKMPFDGALRGIGGEYEIARVLGGFGALIYTICANLFVGYEVIIAGKDFDITAYCVAFPGGLAGIIGAAAGAVALKDRNVASSKYIERHGIVPAKPAEPQRRNALGDPVADEPPAGTADDPVHVTEQR